MKPGGIWIVLGTLTLVVILGYGCYELIQRHRYSILEVEIEAALREFEKGGKLVPIDPNEGPLRLATASETPVSEFHVNPLREAGISDWGLTADMRTPEGGYLCSNFRVCLRQERTSLLLSSPRVLVVQRTDLHPSVWNLFTQALKNHGIDYTRASVVP